MSPSQRLFSILAAAILLAASGCGDSSGSSTAAPSVAEEKASPAARDEGKALEAAWPSVEVGSKLNVPDAPPPKKLVVKELEKGDGPVAKSGDSVEILYVDALYSSGEVVSLAVPGAPFHLELGAGGSIPGWEKGIVGMRVGGRRELIVPAALALDGEAHLSLIGLVGVE